MRGERAKQGKGAQRAARTPATNEPILMTNRPPVPTYANAVVCSPNSPPKAIDVKNSSLPKCVPRKKEPPFATKVEMMEKRLEVMLGREVIGYPALVY